MCNIIHRKMKLYILAFTVVLLVTGAFAESQHSSKTERRLIKFPRQSPIWMTEGEIYEAAIRHLNFIDVTDRQEIDKYNLPKIYSIPTTLHFNTTVQSAISRLNASRLEQFMISFTEFYTRYWRDPIGVEASNWLTAHIQNFITSGGYIGRASVVQYIHNASPQPSVIARIEGSTPEVVILGAHLDSISGDERAPGADDNASGSATILETFKVLLEIGFVPRTTIEFHWYAAEEQGLRGSGEIAGKYRAEERGVVAMVNFDMTGFVKDGNRTIAIMTDYTDADVNQFLRILIDEYCTVGWANKECFGCSDHASWNENGFRAGFPHEIHTSPHNHHSRDSMETVTMSQVIEFTKLAVGYAIELAQPQSIKS